MHTDRKWKKEFRKNIPQTDIKLLETGESEPYYFGYKHTIGDEVAAVTDWSRVESFIEALMKKQLEDVKGKLIELHANPVIAKSNRGKTMYCRALSHAIESLTDLGK